MSCRRSYELAQRRAKPGQGKLKDELIEELRQEELMLDHYITTHLAA